MIETVIAVSIITFVFLGLFELNRLLTAKILTEHAAFRVERARSVGLNDFMCRKVARVVTIPVSGRRLWPEQDEENSFDYSMELARLPAYMLSKNPAVARGILEYEGWNTLNVEPVGGNEARVTLGEDWFKVKGKASMENNFELYMDNSGL